MVGADGPADGPAEGVAGTDERVRPAAAPSRPAPRALVVFGLIAALVVGLDVFTKYLAVTHLTDRPPVRILGGLLYLDVIRNSGAAFSVGTGLTWLFPLIAVVVVGWIVMLSRRLRSAAWAVALGLVLGGVFGNLGDRLFRAPGFLVGHVVDFASLFGPDAKYWPVFNVADASLCCGVVLVVLLELTGRRRDGSRASAGTAPGTGSAPGVGSA
jgi:signal peptidase II